MVDGTWYWVKWDEGGGRRNKLEDVDLESFQIIDRELAKDKDSVWDSGLHHFRVDGSRVVILGRSWIKDDKHVYCRNGNIGLIDGLEASKFTEIHPNVFSDGKRFFIDWAEVSGSVAHRYIKNEK